MRGSSGAPGFPGAGEPSRLTLKIFPPSDCGSWGTLPVAAFLESPLARRMSRAGALKLHRELPFALRLEARDRDPPGPAVVVRGQIDALLLDGNEATVVDYKLSRPGAPRRYDFQLDAYALAARELTASSVPVRSGLVFLRSPSSAFAPREASSASEMDRIRARLLDAARTIASGRRTAVWPKVKLERCRELQCGFLHRCHPEEVIPPAG